jgi:hypothetical protein
MFEVNFFLRHMFAHNNLTRHTDHY